MSRPLFRRVTLGLVLAIPLLGATGCTPSPTAAPSTAISRIETVTYGVVVSMRPITVPPDTVASIMRAVGDVVGTAAAEAAPANTPETVEFIVREDNGNTDSVVQDNDENLKPGDRVVLRRSAHIRVVRAPSS